MSAHKSAAGHCLAAALECTAKQQFNERADGVGVFYNNICHRHRVSHTKLSTARAALITPGIKKKIIKASISSLADTFKAEKFPPRYLVDGFAHQPRETLSALSQSCFIIHIEIIVCVCAPSGKLVLAPGRPW